MHLPVTALHTLHVHGGRILIVGQGPWLHIYDCEEFNLIATERIFGAQPIHHIAHQRCIAEDHLVAAGGRSIATVPLRWTRNATLELEVTLRHSLPAKEWSLKIAHHDGALLILTTNNNLFQLTDDDSDVSLLTNGPGSFLYSGDLASVHKDRILVAAGSVFGEVLIWECRPEIEGASPSWKSITTHRFEGHNGSVFDVSISGIHQWRGRPSRFVASCSDDRTFQVWDITEPRDETAFRDRGTRPVDTGFGRKSHSDMCRIASGWGHQSRIWGVKLLSANGPMNDEQLKLVTRGEDGTLQLWRSDAESTDATGTFRFVATLSDRHHSGKNVWSWTSYETRDKYVMLTGGADGRVVSRQLPLKGKDDENVTIYRQSCRRLPFDCAAQTLKEYTISQHGSMYALTNGGHVLRIHLDNRETVRWEMIIDQAVLRATKLCSNLPSDMIIVACSTNVFVQSHKSSETSIDLSDHFQQPVARLHVAGYQKSENKKGMKMCLLVTSMSGQACLIWIEQHQDHLKYTIHKLNLPDHFVVTSSCYNFGNEMLILGSRAGAMAFYATSDCAKLESTRIACVRHVHDAETVTSVQFLEGDTNNDTNHILSTGRNGKYCIHRLDRIDSGISALALSTVHSACPPFGPNIEGAFLRTTSTPHQLVLHGFRSKDFVVWNETLQSDVFSVDCGGAHRSWAFYFKDHEDVEGGSFVWTKAGTVNIHQQKATSRRIVQPGGHGREIKALARCPVKYVDAGQELHDVTLIATGAEDTTIRFFSVNGKHIKQLCVLNEHTAGLQGLTFSADGRYLFSCGGSEELFAWRVNYGVPIIGVGVMLLDKMPHRDGDDDVRIMDLSISPGSTIDAGEETFMLAAAYSNGKVKLVRYIPALSGSEQAWCFEKEVLLGTFCLMQVFACGRPADSTSLFMLSTGTNGFLNLSCPSSGTDDNMVISVHSMHQSSILAMDVVQLSTDQLLVATGGDDNAFGVTVISRFALNGSRQEVKSVRIPDAHAAALTSLVIARYQKHANGSAVYIITAGNDQRVQLWRVLLPSRVESPDQIRIAKLGSEWTDVADVSCIEMIDSDVVVSGVGLQILPIDLEHAVEM